MSLIKKEYRVEILSQANLNTINGGGILRDLGRRLGELWKDFKCACGGPRSYEPDYSDLNGPKY